MRSPSDIEEAAEAAARLRLSQRRRDISEGNRSWFRNAPEELAILVLLTVFVGSLVILKLAHPPPPTSTSGPFDPNTHDGAWLSVYPAHPPSEKQHNVDSNKGKNMKIRSRSSQELDLRLRHQLWWRGQADLAQLFVLRAAEHFLIMAEDTLSHKHRRNQPQPTDFTVGAAASKRCRGTVLDPATLRVYRQAGPSADGSHEINKNMELAHDINPWDCNFCLESVDRWDGHDHSNSRPGDHGSSRNSGDVDGVADGHGGDHRDRRSHGKDDNDVNQDGDDAGDYHHDVAVDLGSSPARPLAPVTTKTSEPPTLRYGVPDLCLEEHMLHRCRSIAGVDSMKRQPPADLDCLVCQNLGWGSHVAAGVDLFHSESEAIHQVIFAEGDREDTEPEMHEDCADDVSGAEVESHNSGRGHGGGDERDQLQLLRDFGWSIRPLGRLIRAFTAYVISSSPSSSSSASSSTPGASHPPHFAHLLRESFSPLGPHVESQILRFNRQRIRDFHNFSSDDWSFRGLLPPQLSSNLHRRLGRLNPRFRREGLRIQGGGGGGMGFQLLCAAADPLSHDWELQNDEELLWTTGGGGGGGFELLAASVGTRSRGGRTGTETSAGIADDERDVHEAPGPHPTTLVKGGGGGGAGWQVPRHSWKRTSQASTESTDWLVQVGGGGGFGYRWMPQGTLLHVGGARDRNISRPWEIPGDLNLKKVLAERFRDCLGTTPTKRAAQASPEDKGGQRKMRRTVWLVGGGGAGGGLLAHPLPRQPHGKQQNPGNGSDGEDDGHGQRGSQIDPSSSQNHSPNSEELDLAANWGMGFWFRMDVGQALLRRRLHLHLQHNGHHNSDHFRQGAGRLSRQASRECMTVRRVLPEELGKSTAVDAVDTSTISHGKRSRLKSFSSSVASPDSNEKGGVRGNRHDGRAEDAEDQDNAFTEVRQAVEDCMRRCPGAEENNRDRYHRHRSNRNNDSTEGRHHVESNSLPNGTSGSSQPQQNNDREETGHGANFGVDQGVDENVGVGGDNDAEQHQNKEEHLSYPHLHVYSDCLCPCLRREFRRLRLAGSAWMTCPSPTWLTQ